MQSKSARSVPECSGRALLMDQPGSETGLHTAAPNATSTQHSASHQRVRHGRTPLDSPRSSINQWRIGPGRGRKLSVQLDGQISILSRRTNHAYSGTLLSWQGTVACRTRLDPGAPPCQALRERLSRLSNDADTTRVRGRRARSRWWCQTVE